MVNEYLQIKGPSDDKWVGSSVDYTFLSTLPDYYLDGMGYAAWYDGIINTSSGFSEFSVKQKQAVYYLLEAPSTEKDIGDFAANLSFRVSFSDVINISFNEELQDGNDVGGITFVNANVDTSSTEDGWAFAPTNFSLNGEISNKGDIFIDTLLGSGSPNSNNNDSNIDLGDSGFWLLLHELGHAFGSFKDVEDTSLDPVTYTQKYSVMSYTPHQGVWATGLQLFDILVLQEQYDGRNFNTRADNTVYALGQGLGFSGASENDPFLYTIWDGRGVDTIDASAFSNSAVIDLRQGEFSSIGKNGSGGQAQGNVAIAYYTVIENAIGTSEGDIIIGNAWANRLEGGDGDDRIFGDGNVLDLDVNVGALYNNDIGFIEVDSYRAWNPGDDGILPPTLPDIPGSFFFSTFDDYIIGGAGNDIIYGSAGGDRIVGGDGLFSPISYDEDQMYGGGGNDWFFADAITLGGVLYHGGQAGMAIEDDGFDWIDFRELYDLTSGYVINLADGYAQDRSTLITVDLVSIEKASGTYLDDIIYGADTPFTEIRGEDGDDVIYSGTGETITHGGTGNDTLYGGAGFDGFDGNEGDDTAYGGGGNDNLNGQEGGDHLYGGDDNDTLEAGSGDDFAYGEAGNDQINAGSGYDHYDGGDGIDTIAFQTYLAANTGVTINLQAGTVSDDGWGNTDTVINIENVFGSEYNDSITGDNGANELNGYVGNDTLNGGTGNDYLIGGMGDDTYIYTSGIVRIKDQANSGGSDDFIKLNGVGSGFILESFDGEGDGNSDDLKIIFQAGVNEIHILDQYSIYDYNRIEYLDFGGLRLNLLTYELWTVGTSSSQTIIGDQGSAVEDTVLGMGGDDIIRGLTGSDTLSGGEGADVIFGDDQARNPEYIGAGSDILYGGTGEDRLYGGAGNDTLFGEEDDDILFGDTGDDFLDGGAGNDNLRGLEGSDEILGGDGDDYLFGDDTTRDPFFIGAGYDVLRGGLGADRLYGGAGGDVLYGGDGADRLYGDADGDDLFGEDGADIIYGGDGSDALIGGSGADVMYGEEGSDLLDGGPDNDNLRGGSGNDNLRGRDGDDRLYGDADSDTLRGETGNDYLYGDDASDLDGGSDLLDGGADNDRLYGYAGSDELRGGDGEDRLWGGTGGDLLRGGNDRDYLYGEADEDTLLGEIGDDLLYGGTGHDFLVGGDGVDLLDGEDGDDTLQGESGSDTLRGRAGFDVLEGGEGDDRLYGGDDSDYLIGGLGVDNLYGEGGGDIFYFGMDGYEVGVMDIVRDFSTVEGDSVNIADILSYDSTLGDILSDFVQLQSVGGGLHTRIRVDIDGTGTDHTWTNLAQLQDVTGLNLTDLVTNGNLIAE